jgi:hypothetical protein
MKPTVMQTEDWDNNATVYQLTVPNDCFVTMQDEQLLWFRLGWELIFLSLSPR